MARPKVEDDTLEKADRIIGESVTVPLPPEELSANQKLRIIVDAVYAEMKSIDEEDRSLIVDRHDISRESKPLEDLGNN